MRQGIHPEYHPVEATCVCGNTVVTGSVLPEIKLDICSACHPFFTGQQKIVDTEGRVERFKKRFDKQDAAAALSAKKAKRLKAQEEERARKEKEAKEREEAIKLANKPKRDKKKEGEKKLKSETRGQRGLDVAEKPAEGEVKPAEASPEAQPEKVEVPAEAKAAVDNQPAEGQPAPADEQPAESEEVTKKAELKDQEQ